MATMFFNRNARERKKKQRINEEDVKHEINK